MLERKLCVDDVILFTAMPPAAGSVPGTQLIFTELTSKYILNRNSQVCSFELLIGQVYLISVWETCIFN